MFETLHDAVVHWLADGFVGAAWWQIVLYAIVATHITIAAVTIFLHRAQAHRALELGFVPFHFFRLWLWLATGMVTKEWVAIHRKHHAKCETAEDPHSPVTHGIKTVLLTGGELYRAEAKKKETLEKYGRNTPDDWLERNLYSRFVWQGVGLMLITDLFLFGAIGATVWAVQMAWIPVTAAGIINGLGHFKGYRNFEAPDASTNILPIGFIIGGEELHNNHHTYPTSAKLSVKPYEFDIGWGYIRLLEMVGWARVLHRPPELERGEGRSMVDQTTLGNLIKHRHAVMALLNKRLRSVLNDERRFLTRQGAKGSDLARKVRLSLKWLGYPDRLVPEGARDALREVAANRPRLEGLLRLKAELSFFWTNRSLSPDQLIARLRFFLVDSEALSSADQRYVAGLIRSLR